MKITKTLYQNEIEKIIAKYFNVDPTMVSLNISYESLGYGLAEHEEPYISCSVVEKKCLDKEEEIYSIIFTTDDYDSEKNELSARYVKEIYDYLNYEDFRKGWFELLSTREGDWYWIVRNGKVILSGAFDPQDADYLFEL